MWENVLTATERKCFARFYKMSIIHVHMETSFHFELAVNARAAQLLKQ